MKSSLPLRDVRVLDFTWAIAGPFSATLLALLGAEVIKVESRTRPDTTRRTPPNKLVPPEELDSSTRFVEWNLNKLSVQINLKEPDGARLARDLVRISNVVVENLRSGTMDRLGLGYEALRKITPDLIMLSASMGGGTGPDGQRPGYAPIFNAMGGLGYVTGYDDGPPTELRQSVDARVASTGAYALLAALYHWRETGEGQHIQLSATESIAALIGDTFLEYAMNKRSPRRAGNRDSFMAPHDCYRCLEDDSWVSIAVASDGEWRALCQAMGMPQLATDERFADTLSRWRHQDALRPVIESWTREHTDHEVMEILQEVGVAAVPSFTFGQLVNSPHIQERGVNVEIRHEILGSLTLPGLSWKLSEITPVPYRSAPLLGEHNQYVFGQLLGLSQGELANLMDRRVIY